MAQPSFLVFNANEILPTIFKIIAVFFKYPGAYLPILGSWIITSAYFIIHHEEKPGHTYAMSTGIALAFTGISIIFNGVATYSVRVGTIQFYAVLWMVLAGIILIVISLLKYIPDWIADFFGDPNILIVPTLLVLFFVDGSIRINLTTFVVVVVPALFLMFLRFLRQITKK